MKERDKGRGWAVITTRMVGSCKEGSRAWTPKKNRSMGHKMQGCRDGNGAKPHGGVKSLTGGELQKVNPDLKPGPSVPKVCPSLPRLGSFHHYGYDSFVKCSTCGQGSGS